MELIFVLRLSYNNAIIYVDFLIKRSDAIIDAEAKVLTNVVFTIIMCNYTGTFFLLCTLFEILIYAMHSIYEVITI